MERLWPYEDNVFLNVTDHNYELSFSLNQFHYNALLAQPDNPMCVERAAFFKPFNDTFQNSFTNWKAQGGKQKSDTLTVNQLLALTTQKLNSWEPKILILFPKGSAGYVNLFPRGRYPFTTGTKEQRINAYNTFALALAATPALDDVRKEVEDYYKQLSSQQSTQKQSIDNTDTGSKDVEAARVAACDAMFCDLGYIMAFYYKDRSRIGGFFDLEKIRYHEQVIFQRHVKPQETLFIVKHKFAADDMITAMNKGVTKLYLFEGDSKTAVFKEEDSIAFEPGETVKIEAGKLGAPDKAFLFVYNPDSITDGECEIDFM